MAKDIVSKYVKKANKKAKPIVQKSGSWMTNVLKSVGYASFDVLTELTPSTIDAAKSTAQASQDLVNSIRKVRTTDRTLKTALEKNYYVGLGKDLLKNSLEDLKSGKLYNKDRSQKYFDSMNDDMDFGDMGFGDEDFDSSFDDFDGSVESSDGLSQASFKRKSSNGNDFTNIVVNTDLGPDSSVVQATEFQTETTINVGRAIVDNTRVQNRAVMAMLGEFKNEINTNLSSINENISTITTTVSESLGKHTTLSAKFYEDSISIQNQILEQLTKISSGATNQINTKEFKDYNNVMDIMGSGGGIDFKAYLNLVKKQFTNYSDSNMFLSQLKFMNDNKEGFQMMAMNPFQNLLTGGIKALIPSVTKKALTNFDNQLKETSIAALNQISGLQRSDNPFFRAIGQIFGIQNKVTTKIDKSAYNKGAMSWNGMDHQALTNVIPTLLRKIYASVSGTQEIDFDYENGVFRNVKDMEKEVAKNKKYRETSGLSEYKTGFSEYLNANFAANSDEKKKFTDTFENFLGALVKDSYGGRTFRKGGRNGKDETDDIAELIGLSSNSPEVQLIRSYLNTLEKTNKSSLTYLFGAGIQEQRASYDKYIREIQNDPTKFNTKYLDSGLTGKAKTDAHLNFDDKNDSSRPTSVKSGLAAGTFDKYGRNQNYYLREILSVLTTGIYVVPIGSISGDNESDNNILDAINNKRSTIFNNYRSDKNKARRDSESNMRRTSSYDRQKDIDNGKIDINSEFTDEQLSALALGSVNEAEEESQTWLSKILDKLPEDSGARRILNRVKSVRTKVGDKVGGVIDKATEGLFDIVFGTGKEGKGFKGLLDKTMNILKGGFKKFTSFLDEKVLKPIDEALFGKDGFITKIKESEFGKKLSEGFKNATDKIGSFLFGDKGADGTRSGGLFSETANSLKDIGTNVKHAIFGEVGPDGKRLPLEQDNSILGNTRKMFKSATDSIKESLGIKKSDEPIGTRLSNITADVANRIKERASDWSEIIFGKKDEKGNFTSSILNNEFMSEFKEDMKGQKGFIGASAGLGVLGSFFLPGGPIGGALVGTGIGIITKSKGLQRILFGEKDANGERMGGIITKDIQKFFKDNKVGMSVGALGGLISSFGLLPSFFFPGGPIGGAILGGTVSLITKSEAFNELLYGEGGTKDDPTGGLMSKLKGKFGKDKNFKTLGIDAGIGAGVGLLGSFFLPGGPIIGALMGSALSIGTATDKFRNWFFGEQGEDGKRTGGVFNKFTGFMKEKVFSPLATSVKVAQTHVMQFVEENMVLPFKYAIDPLIKEASRVKDLIKGKITDLFDSFKTKLTNRVVKPIGDTVEKYLLNPLKKTLSKLFSGFGKLIGGLISAPFKMLGAAGWSAYDKQKKRGKEDYIQNSGRGFFGKLGMRLGLVDREGVNAAQYGENGASYEAGQEIERRQRYKDEQNAIRDKYNRKRFNIRNGIEETPNTASSTTSVESAQNTTTSVDTSNQSSVSANTNDDSQRLLSNRDERLRQARRRSNKNKKGKKNKNRNRSTVASDTTTSVDTSNHYSASVNGDDTYDASFDTPTFDSQVSGETNTNSTSSINVPSTTSVDTSSSYSPPKGNKSKPVDTGKSGSNIAKDVAKIRDSVEGQLNGVGSNVNKIYKLLLRKFKESDDNIKGDNNKDRVGIFGKLKGALRRPIDTAISLITTPFVKIGDAITGIVGKVKEYGGKFIGTIGKAGKFILKGIGSVVTEVAKLPFKIINTGLSIIKSLAPALGEALKAGLSVITTGIKVAGETLVAGVKSVGNIISGAAQGLGSLLGGAMQGLGSILSTMGLIGKDVIKGIWGGMKFLGKGAFNIAKGVISAPFNLVGGIIDRIGGKRKGKGLFGRGPVHVIVDSGVLDRVKKVNVVKLVEKIVTKSDDSTNLGGLLSSNQEGTTRVNNGTGSLDMNLQLFGNGRNQKEDTEGDTTKVGFKESLLNLKSKLSNLGGTIRDKLKRKDEAERIEQAERGSRASVETRIAEEDKAKEEKTFREKMLSFLKKGNDTAEEHKKGFLDIFGIKKGLITAGLIALAPFLFKAFKSIFPILQDFVMNIGNDIKTGFGEIGGLLGFLNNQKETGERVSDTIKGEDTHIKVEDGKLVYDEKGNLITETTDSNRFLEAVMPTRTRINTETGEWENRKVFDKTGESVVNKGANLTKTTVKKGFKVYKKGKEVASVLAKGGRKLKSGVSTAATKFGSTKVGTGIKNKATSVGGTIKSGVSTTATKVGTGIKNKAASVGSKMSSKLANNDGLIANAIKMMKQALDFLIEKFISLGSKYGIKITESKFGTILKSVKSVLTPKKLSKLSTKIADFVTKITSKTAVSSSTLLLAEIGFALYGAIDGATNAAGLFEVRDENVDPVMAAISGVFKALLATSIGSWIDLISSLVYDLLGFNFVKSIATTVYNLIMSDDKEEKLKIAQEQFTKDYETYVQSEYDAYVESAKEQGQKPMSVDEFKASELSTTRSEYNSKVNKSLGRKIVDTFQNTGNAIGKFGSGVGKFASNTWDKAVTGVKSFGSGVGKFASNTWDKAKSFGSDTISFVKDGFNGAKDAVMNSTPVKFISGFIKKVGPKVKDYVFGNVENIDIGFPEDNPCKPIATIMERTLETLLFGPKALVKAGKGIGKFFKGIFSAAKEIVPEIINNGKDYILGNQDNIMLSDNEGLSVLNVAGKAMEYALLIPRTIVKMGKGIGEFIGKSINSVTDLIPKMGTEAKSYITGESDNINLSLNDDNIFSGITKLINKVIEVVLFPVRLIGKGISSVSNIIGDVSGVVSNTAGNAIDGVKNFFGGIGDAVSGFTNFFTNGKGGTGRLIGGKGGSGEELNGMPYYSQNDPKYKNKKYNQTGGYGSPDDTMGESGCGPTAMAMVASKYAGKNYDPMVMAKMSEAGGYSSSIGTNPNFFTDAGNALGIANQKLSPNSDNLSYALNSGNSVILQGINNTGNNPYTNEGHYVLATGIDNGNVIINDPRGTEYSGAYNINDVLNNTLGMWSFGGKGSKRMGKGFRNFKGGKGGSGWLQIVATTKKEFAKSKPGYYTSNGHKYIKLTVNGKTLNTRTDCTGFVGACVYFYTGKLKDQPSSSSYIPSDGSVAKTLESVGFKRIPWSGWENVKAGDILSVNGHCEISAEDGTKKVYNAGSTSSCNNPGVTNSGHSSYSCIYRPSDAGSAGIMNTSSESTTDTSTTSTISSSSGGITSITDMLSGAASAVTDSIMQSLGLSSSNTDTSTTSTTDNTIGVSSGSNTSISVNGNTGNNAWKKGGTAGKSDSFKGGTSGQNVLAKQMWNYLTSIGFSEASAAGIIGNAIQESGINPLSNLNTNSTKYKGIFQLDINSRFANMKKWAAKHGLDWKSAEAQTRFAVEELVKLRDPYFKKFVGISSMDYPNITDPKQAAHAWVAGYEGAIKGPSNGVNTQWQEDDKRQNYAQQYYDKLRGGKGGKGTGKPLKTIGGYGEYNKVSASAESLSSYNPRTDSIKGTGSISSNDISQLLNTVIDCLSQIVNNTGATSEGLDKLNSKNFGSYSTNNVVSTTNNSYNQTNAPKNNNTADRSKYNMAKRIAAGILS